MRHETRTPDFSEQGVAALVNRLFRAETPDIPDAGMPVLPSDPTGSMPAVPMSAVPSMPMQTPSAPNALGMPSMPLTDRSQANAYMPAGLGGMPAVPKEAPASSIPSDGVSESGLQAFVARVRENQLAGEFGHGNTHELERLRRIFTSAAANGGAGYDANSARTDFPALNQRINNQPLVWLDNAATTHKPQAVIDAVSRFYAHDYSNIHRAAHTLAARATDQYENARKRIARFVGASSPEEIVYVRGTTEGVNLIANSYVRSILKPGDEIVMSMLEHHAVIVPLQMLAKEVGAILRVIPIDDRGEVILPAYQALLGPKTRFVALTHASNSLGTVLPVHEMTHMAKKYGAAVLIDGAQTVAHTPIDVRQMDCDFFVFSGHKVFAPTGIGVVYAKREVLEAMPPWQGGGNMIENVTFEETTFARPPARFEAGTPSIGDAVGLGAALEYLERLGLGSVSNHEHELLQHATDRLSRIDGLRIIGAAREKVGVVSFVLAGRTTEEVGKALDREGIAVRAGHHCAQPSLRRFGLESTVRPSFALYNTHDDVTRLANAVHKIARRSF